MGKIKFKYGHRSDWYKESPLYLKGMINNGDLETNTILYKKHQSVGDEDVGKLMMIDVSIVTDPPSGYDDVEVTAIVCNPESEELGLEGQYELAFAPLVEPKCKNGTFTFSCIPSSGDTVVFTDTTALSSYTITFVDGSPGVNEVQVDGGATLADVVTAFHNLLISATWIENGAINDLGGGVIELTGDLLLGSTTAGFTNDSTVDVTLALCILFTENSNRTSQETYDAAVEVKDRIGDGLMVASASSWDTSGQSAAIVMYTQLFSTTSGNTSGHAGTAYFDDVLFYDDSTEYASGIQWAMENCDSDDLTAYNFSDMFTVISAVPAEDNVIVTVETVGVPNLSTNSITFGATNEYFIGVDEIQEPIAYFPEMVNNIVLGTLVAVHEDYVTIDVSHVLTVKLHEESVAAVVPYHHGQLTSQVGIPWVIAWKDGTVIDYFTFASGLPSPNGDGIIAYLVYMSSYAQGWFNALSPAEADMTLHVRRGGFVFFGS